MIANQNIKFNFTGKIIRLIGTSNAGCSTNIVVELDGIKHYAHLRGSLASGICFFEKIFLDDTEHTVKIYAEDTNVIQLLNVVISKDKSLLPYNDTITLPTNSQIKKHLEVGLIYLPTAETGMTRHLYSEPEFTCSGATVIDANTVKTKAPGSIKVKFTGTKLRVIGQINLAALTPSSTVDIIVDKKRYRVDTLSSIAQKSNICFLYLDNLPAGDHYLEICTPFEDTGYVYVTGIDIESTAAVGFHKDLTGRSITDLASIGRDSNWKKAIEFIQDLRASFVLYALRTSPDGMKLVQADDVNISYVGSWINYGIYDELNYHYTTAINDSFKFNFTGKSIKLIADCMLSSSSEIEIYLDGNKLKVTQVLATRASRVVYFEIQGLDDTEHSIIITNKISGAYFINQGCYIESSATLLPYSPKNYTITGATMFDFSLPITAGGISSFNFTGDKLSLIVDSTDVDNTLYVAIDGKQFVATANINAIAGSNINIFEIKGLAYRKHHCSIYSSTAVTIKGVYVDINGNASKDLVFKNYMTTFQDATTAESGWSRIAANDAGIIYTGTTMASDEGLMVQGLQLNGKICFNFTGNYFRLLSAICYTSWMKSDHKCNVNIDGVDFGNFEMKNSHFVTTGGSLFRNSYQSPKLTDGSHYVEITVSEVKNGSWAFFAGIDYIATSEDIIVTDSGSSGMQLEGRGLQKINPLDSKKMVVKGYNYISLVAGIADVGNYTRTDRSYTKLKFSGTARIRIMLHSDSSVNSSIHAVYLDGNRQNVRSLIKLSPIFCAFDADNLDLTEHDIEIFRSGGGGYFNPALVIMDEGAILLNPEEESGDAIFKIPSGKKVVKMNNKNFRTFSDYNEKLESFLKIDNVNTMSQDTIYTSSHPSKETAYCSIAKFKSKTLKVYAPALEVGSVIVFYINGIKKSFTTVAATGIGEPILVLDIDGLDNSIENKLEIETTSGNIFNIDYIEIDSDGEMIEYKPDITVGKSVFNPVIGYRTLMGVTDEPLLSYVAANSMGMKYLPGYIAAMAGGLDGAYVIDAQAISFGAGIKFRFNVISKRLKIKLSANAAVTDLRIKVNGVELKNISASVSGITSSYSYLVLDEMLTSSENYISVESNIGANTFIRGIEIDMQGRLLPYDETCSFGRNIETPEKTLINYDVNTGMMSDKFKGVISGINSRVEFKFTGTSFIVIGGYSGATISSILNIYIDDVLEATINPSTIAGTYSDLVLFRKDGLSLSEHTISIRSGDVRNTKISAVLVDGISSKYFKPLLGDKIAENILPNDWETFYFKDDAKKTDEIIRLEKNSSFTQLVVGSAGSCIIGTATYVGETIKFKFTGKILGILSYISSSYASDNKITVDGVDYAFDNKTYTNIANPDGNKVSFYKDDLSDAEHEVTIQNTTSITANACNIVGIIIGKGKTFLSYGEKTEGDISIVAETGWKSWDTFLNNMLFYKGGQLANPDTNSPKILLNAYFNVSDAYFGCKFKFKGTKLRIVGVKRITGTNGVVGVKPDGGHYMSEDVTVEIDGVEVGTFSQLTTYRNAANVINFVKTDISPGTHNCRIYSKSYPLKFFSITRIDVDETDGSFDNYYDRPTLASPEAGTQRIEVVSTDKRFLAVNTLTNNSDALASGSSYSSTTGELSFNVTTTSIKIISIVNAGNDKLGVWIDGVLEGTFSTYNEYNSSIEYKYLAFEKSGMENIEHFVEIKPVNSDDSNKYILIDAIDVDTTAVVSTGVGSLIATPEAGWKRVLATDATSVRTTGYNYRTAMKFTGTKVRVLSFNNLATPIRVVIDGVDMPIVVMAISAANTISYENKKLSEGEHLIEVYGSVSVPTVFNITGFDVHENSVVSKPDWKVGDYVTETVYPEGNQEALSDCLTNMFLNNTFYIRKVKVLGAKKTIITDLKNAGVADSLISADGFNYVNSSAIDYTQISGTYKKVLKIINSETAKDLEVVLYTNEYNTYTGFIHTDGTFEVPANIDPWPGFNINLNRIPTGYKRVESDDALWKLSSTTKTAASDANGGYRATINGSIKFTGKKLSIAGYSAVTSLKLDGVSILGSYYTGSYPITSAIRYMKDDLADIEHTLEVVGTIDCIEVDEGSIVTTPPYVVGDVCVAAPLGMKRIEETDANLTWSGNWTNHNHPSYSVSAGKYTLGLKNSVNFILKSKKLNFICQTYSNQVDSGIIKINGVPYSFSQKNFNGLGDGVVGTYQVICFMKDDLPDGENIIEIICRSNSLVLEFDAIDIDQDGYILPYSPPPEYKDYVPTPRSGYKRVEQSDDVMCFRKYYDGLTWGDYVYADFSSGTAKYTITAKDQASFKFTGTKLAIITFFRPSGYATSVEIWIDGILKATNSCLFSDQAQSCLFSDYSLENKEHTCVIKNIVGSGYLFLDAIDVDKNATVTKWRPDYVVGDAAPEIETKLGWKRYDSENSNIYYEAGWTTVSESSAYNGSYKTCSTVSKKAGFNFTGNKLRLIARTSSSASNGNNCKCVVNGVEYSFNSYDSLNRPQVLVLQIDSGITPKPGFEDNICEIYSTNGIVTLDAVETDGELTQYNPTPNLFLFKKDDLYYNINVNTGKIDLLGTEVSDTDYVDYGISVSKLKDYLNEISGYRVCGYVADPNLKKITSLEVNYIPKDCTVIGKDDYEIPMDVLKIEKIKFPNSVSTGTAECRITFSLDGGVTWKKYNVVTDSFVDGTDATLGNFATEFELISATRLLEIFEAKKIRFRYFFTKDTWIDAASVNQLQFIMDYKAYEYRVYTGYEMRQKNGQIEVDINTAGSYTIKWFN